MGNKALENEELLKLIAAEMLTINNACTDRLDVFTPGLYVRNLRMPADHVFITEKHKSMHPYFVMAGKIHVWSEQSGWKLIEAPYMGITIPGTQRLFRTYSDVIWATVHATTVYPIDDSREAHEDAVNEITNLIIEKTDNLYLDRVMETEVLK